MAIDKEISREQIIALRGCYSEEEINKLQIMSQEKITLEDIMETTEVSLGDKLWFVDRLLTQSQKQQVALIISRVLLRYFFHPVLEGYQEALEAHNKGDISLEDLRTARQNTVGDFFWKDENSLNFMLYRFIVDAYTSYKFTTMYLANILKDPIVNPEIQADIIRELLLYFKDNF